MDVPEDLDPGEVLSLLFPYMTSYQVLHRTAKVKRGETALVHGAAGRVGVAALELGTVAGLRLFGTAAGRDRAKVEALGAVAIDYQNEDFLASGCEARSSGRTDSTPRLPSSSPTSLDRCGAHMSLRSLP